MTTYIVSFAYCTEFVFRCVNFPLAICHENLVELQTLTFCRRCKAELILDCDYIHQDTSTVHTRHYRVEGVSEKGRGEGTSSTVQQSRTIS